MLFASVSLAAAVAPVLSTLEDRALGDTIHGAPYTSRDILVARPAALDPEVSAEEFRDEVLAVLPPDLADVVEVTWAYQRTRLAVGFGGTTVHGAALTGPGVTGEPEHAAPVLSFHAHSGMDADITIVDGAAPATDPAGGAIEVLVAEDVAHTLGVVVGGEYALHPGVVRLRPDPAPPGASQPAIRVAGLFAADSPDDPVWEHPAVVPLHLHEMHVPPWSPYDDPVRVLRAGVLTDDRGFTRLASWPLVPDFEPRREVRVRVDPDQVDAAWLPGGRDAVLALQVDPRAQGYAVDTGLVQLLTAYEGQATAVRAVAAITTTGTVGAGLALVGLAAWLIVDMRRAELRLLRARGASLWRVGGRLGAEALPAAVVAGLGGWVVHHLLVAAVEGQPARVGVAYQTAWQAGRVVPVLLLVLAALAALMAAGAWTAAKTGGSERHRGAAARRSPAWVTVEVGVAVFAVVGAWAVRQRGLVTAGVDPYLSATPLLLALAAGLVMVRTAPWAWRTLAGAAGRLRGAVWFLALARTGRDRGAAAGALLVLVLGVSVAGVVGAVHTGVMQAREVGAVQAVGADLRVDGHQLPDAAVTAVAALPGAVEVVPAYRPTVHAGGRALVGPQVVAVDGPSYQRLLAAMDIPVDLDETVLSASAGDQAVPVLAGPNVAHREDLTIRLDGREYPADVVGVVPDAVPLLGGGADWVLVPAQALVPAPLLDEILVAGPVDEQEVRDAVAPFSDGTLTVHSAAASRAELERFGFNPALTVILGVGTMAGVLIALLAVVFWLAGQAREQQSSLSLLRSIGLSGAQSRLLVLAERIPTTVLAVVTGVGVGVATPMLLAPALGLDALTGGGPLVIEPTTAVVASLVVLALALLVVGVATRSTVSRHPGGRRYGR